MSTVLLSGDTSWKKICYNFSLVAFVWKLYQS